MNEIEVLDIARDAIFTLIKVVSPILLVALFIGLVVGKGRHLYVRTKAKNLAAHFVLKTRNYRQCNEHDTHAQGNAYGGNAYSGS